MASPPPEAPAVAAGTSGVPRRLILTSDGLTSQALQQEFFRMLGRPASEATVWYIPTALLRDGNSMSQAKYMRQSIERDLGLKRVEMIDIEYVRGEELKRALAELGRVDVVWAEMGNTYALRHHLRTSGGEELVLSLLDAGAMYVGSSAGSIVAGRTVQTAFWKDWDDRTAEGTIEVDWTEPAMAQGLNLAGGRSIFPHARRGSSYGNKAWQDAQAAKHGHTDHEVIRLDDGEGFVLDGDRAFVVA